MAARGSIHEREERRLADMLAVHGSVSIGWETDADRELWLTEQRANDHAMAANRLCDQGRCQIQYYPGSDRILVLPYRPARALRPEVIPLAMRLGLARPAQ
jgi:hypothetical protein